MKTKLFILITLMLMCSGCGDWMCDNLGWFCKDTPSNKPEVNTLQDVEEAYKTVEESSGVIEKASGEISNEANKINTEANEVKGKISGETKLEIDPHLDSIKESSKAILEDTTTINKATAELEGAKSLLDNAGKKVIIIETALDTMTAERGAAIEAKRKAEADRDSQMQKMLQWLIISCIVGAGICVVAFFAFGNKTGLIGAGACILILALASFVQAYFIYLAIIGGCLLLLLLIGLIWNIIVQKRAFSQVVETVEVAQDNMSEEARNKIFGGEGEQGIMKNVQNKETVDLVQKEKNKMSSLWNYAKNKKGEKENN